MAIRFLRIVNAKQALRRALMVSEASTVPKEHLAVYVGEIEKSRFVVPVSYLKHPSFQNLLSQAEEEFVENTSYENSAADTDDKVACHFSYTRLKTEYVEDLLSWQNGITEESQ